METGAVYVVTKSNLGGTLVEGDVFYKSFDGKYHNVTCDTVFDKDEIIGEFQYEPYTKCVCLVDENGEWHVFNVDYVRSVLDELSV